MVIYYGRKVNILLMEEILHHLGCEKTLRIIMGHLPYQLVQDYFHQQYHFGLPPTQ